MFVPRYSLHLAQLLVRGAIEFELSDMIRLFVQACAAHEACYSQNLDICGCSSQLLFPPTAIATHYYLGESCY